MAERNWKDNKTSQIQTKQGCDGGIVSMQCDMYVEFLNISRISDGRYIACALGEELRFVLSNKVVDGMESVLHGCKI